MATVYARLQLLSSRKLLLQKFLVTATWVANFPFYRVWQSRRITYLIFPILQIRKSAFRGWTWQQHFKGQFHHRQDTCNIEEHCHILCSFFFVARAQTHKARREYQINTTLCRPGLTQSDQALLRNMSTPKIASIKRSSYHIWLPELRLRSSKAFRTWIWPLWTHVFNFQTCRDNLVPPVDLAMASLDISRPFVTTKHHCDTSHEIIWRRWGPKRLIDHILASRALF